MRILFTIPHYFNPTGGKARDGRDHGSAAVDPKPRVEALTACLTALNQLYDQAHCVLDHARKVVLTSQPRIRHWADVVICTVSDKHLGALLPALPHYSCNVTKAEPLLLGYECHAVLRDRLGHYDYYCYLEDDLVMHDPWFFLKLAWFTKQFGSDRLLQPNRYEVGPHSLVNKVYVDGDLREPVTAPFQNRQENGQLITEILGVPVTFQRPLNPHSGCFFLSADQMSHWSKQPYFLDRAYSFIGPLESAASLGIQRAFKVYKPALENADFLEIQHYGSAYLSMIATETDANQH